MKVDSKKKKKRGVSPSDSSRSRCNIPILFMDISYLMHTLRYFSKIRGLRETKLSIASIRLMPSPKGLTSHINDRCTMLFFYFPMILLKEKRKQGISTIKSAHLECKQHYCYEWFVPTCTLRKFKLVQVLTISTINTHTKKI
jgi:hypothetical protein